MIRYKRSLRYRRILPFQKVEIRYRRDWPRHRRHVVGEGYFIPNDGDLEEMMLFCKNKAKKVLQSVIGVHSPLNNLEEFYSRGLVGLSSVLKKYPAFHTKVEFEKLAKTSIQNRIKDQMRDMFRQKRWGFSVSFVEESSDDVISTVAVVSHQNSVQLTALENLSVPPEDNYSLNELLGLIRPRVSEDSYNVLVSLVEDESPAYDHSFRKEKQEFFLELQGAIQDLVQLKFLNSFDLSKLFCRSAS